MLNELCTKCCSEAALRYSCLEASAVILCPICRILRSSVTNNALKAMNHFVGMIKILFCAFACVCVAQIAKIKKFPFDRPNSVAGSEIRPKRPNSVAYSVVRPPLRRYAPEPHSQSCGSQIRSV